MLAHPEMQIAPTRGVGFQIPCALKSEARLGGWREVGRTADEPWVMRRDGVEHLA